MKYTWEFDRQSQQDQIAIRRVFDRWPDTYQCAVAHPEPGRWTFWLKRGAGSYILQFGQSDIEAHQEELVHEAYRAVRAIEDLRTQSRVKENDPDIDEAGYVRMRLADHERGMTRRAIEQEMEAGVLSGLEFLGHDSPVRPGDSLFLPGKSAPVIDHTNPTGRYHND